MTYIQLHINDGADYDLSTLTKRLNVMKLHQRSFDVVSTLSRCIDLKATLYTRHVPAVYLFDILRK